MLVIYKKRQSVYLGGKGVEDGDMGRKRGVEGGGGEEGCQYE